MAAAARVGFDESGVLVQWRGPTDILRGGLRMACQLVGISYGMARHATEVDIRAAGASPVDPAPRRIEIGGRHRLGSFLRSQLKLSVLTGDSGGRLA